MSILTIQFGQCGNQIGHTLFQYLLNDMDISKNSFISKSVNVEYAEETKKIWFSDYKNSCYVPRSILVDTENKVIKSITNNKDSLAYDNVIAKSVGGSANNWAFGYTVKAKLVVDEIVDAVRKEIEKSSNITHILGILSSGGGTGSGTGSRVLESLRKAFPNKTILNVIILPYKKGEIVTQNYNTLLTLAKLHDVTDGTIIFENDILHGVCSSLLTIKNVHLQQMNRVVAQKLCSVFQPVNDNYTINDFTSHLMSHPGLKFVQIRATPHIATEHLKYEISPNWCTLFGHMRNTLRSNFELHDDKIPSCTDRYRPTTKFSKSIANLVISRGELPPENNVKSLLNDKELYCTWVPENYRFKHLHQARPLYESNKFVSMATNNNTIVKTFDSVLEQAWLLYTNKAYLHQYEKYDISKHDFENAFEKMESVINNYKVL